MQLLSMAYPGARSSARENIADATVFDGTTGVVVEQILAGKVKAPVKRPDNRGGERCAWESAPHRSARLGESSAT
jgi:hypothetical protein